MELQYVGLKTTNCVGCFGSCACWQGHVVAQNVDGIIKICAGHCSEGQCKSLKEVDVDGCYGAWDRRMGLTYS